MSQMTSLLYAFALLGVILACSAVLLALVGAFVWVVDRIVGRS